MSDARTPRRRPSRRDLAFFARLPFAVLADVLTDAANRIDTRYASALNPEEDE